MDLGTVLSYCALILCSHTVLTYCALILCTHTVLSYCALILCTHTHTVLSILCSLYCFYLRIEPNLQVQLGRCLQQSTIPDEQVRERESGERVGERERVERVDEAINSTVY